MEVIFEAMFRNGGRQKESDDVEKPVTRVPFFERVVQRRARTADIVGQRKRERSSEIPRAREEIISRLERSISRWRVGTPEAGAYIGGSAGSGLTVSFRATG